MRRKFESVLPLQVFVQKSQVKNAYRQLRRATKLSKDPILKVELQQHIRISFRHNQHVTNREAIPPMIHEALSSIQKVKELCQVTSRPQVDVSQRESWLKESDGIDTRGRIGEGWPWEKSDR